MSACLTSLSVTSPTTLKLTSSGKNFSRRWSRCARGSTLHSARVGKSGKSHARPKRTGRPTSRNCTKIGGSSVSLASKRSTPPSPPRPTTNTSTTSPTRTSNKVRVAGPFTVESISPHRVLAVDENDEFIETFGEAQAGYGSVQDFASIILENLRTAGVQQAHKEDRIDFTSLTPWPGHHVCAEGRFFEGGEEDGIQRRAAIFIGPEFGTVSRPDLVEAAREAADGDFDLLIACAFNYEAHTTEFEKLGKIPVLKARMNADLHMAADLKNTGKGNLFVIFGEPDIDLLDAEDNQIKVRVNGVDVFHPNTGEVRSDGPDGIACWFVDTDYNGESFFVRHAYFLGANDPYKALKTTLKAEIDTEAWASLHSDTSRPFDKPDSGRIAVKVINHLGDEVMKIFRVD